jgi:hypothetical protein
VSLDDTNQERNDRIRGEGAWGKAVEAVRLLRERGLLPIVTATEITRDDYPAGAGMYERFRDFLHAQGVERPRVKIMPVFGLGRQPAGATPPLTAEDLEGFDRSVLQCADARVVAAGGVYACPILAGLEGARLSTGSLEASFQPTPLYHPVCVTCRQTGMTCRNS